MGKNSGSCSVEDCNTLAHARGMCATHYSRVRNSELESSHRSDKTSLICTAQGCSAVRRTRNSVYCTEHKGSRRSPEHTVPRRRGKRKRKESIEEFFWSKVKKSETGCWIWTGRTRGGKKRKKYGEFGYNGVSFSSHRYSYELANSVKLLSHTPIHHTCAESLCVNPDHLQAVTPQENLAEMLERRWYLKRIAELEQQLASCTCS